MSGPAGPPTPVDNGFGASGRDDIDDPSYLSADQGCSVEVRVPGNPSLTIPVAGDGVTTQRTSEERLKEDLLVLIGVSQQGNGGLASILIGQDPPSDVFDIFKQLWGEPRKIHNLCVSLASLQGAISTHWGAIKSAVTNAVGESDAVDAPEAAAWVGQGADSFRRYIGALDGIISKLNEQISAVMEIDVAADFLNQAIADLWMIYGQQELYRIAERIIQLGPASKGYEESDINNAKSDIVNIRRASTADAQQVLAGVRREIGNSINSVGASSLTGITFPEVVNSLGADDPPWQPGNAPGGSSGNEGTAPSGADSGTYPTATTGSTDGKSQPVSGSDRPQVASPVTLQGLPGRATSGQPSAPTVPAADASSATSAGAPLPPAGAAVPVGPDTMNAGVAASRAARIRALTVRVGGATVTVPGGQAAAGDPPSPTPEGEVTIHGDGVTVTVHQREPQAGSTDTTAVGAGPPVTGQGPTAPADSGRVFTAEPGGVSPADVHQVLADPSLAATNTTGLPEAGQPGQVGSTAATAAAADTTIPAAAAPAAAGQQPVSVSDASGTFTLAHQQGTYQVGDMTVHDTIDATGAETVTIDSPDGTTVTITDQVDPSTLVSGGGAAPGGSQQLTGAPPGQFVDWSQAAGADPTAMANALAADGIDPRTYVTGTDPTQAMPPATIDPSPVDPTAGTDNPGTA